MAFLNTDLDELFDQDVIDGKHSFAEAVIQAGIIQREGLITLISQYLNYELQVGDVGEIESDVLAVIPKETARQYGVVPLYLSGGGIHLLSIDPFNASIIDDLTFALNLEIHIVVCDPLTVSSLLDHYYPEDQSSMNDVLVMSALISLITSTIPKKVIWWMLLMRHLSSVL